MINENSYHHMLAISNKLFAICCGEQSDISEVYDNFCKKFVVFNSPTFFGGIYYKSITFDRKIVVFKNNSTFVSIYDVDKNEWSEEHFKDTNNIRNFNCLKIPS